MTARICPECSDAECLPRKQKCMECWMRDQPVMVRVADAERRLALVPVELRRGRVPAKDWPEGRRFCAGCQTFVSLRDVSKGSSRCQTCNGMTTHLQGIMKEYGITPDEWNRLFNLQGGRCAICRQPPKKYRLIVDHDHTCDLCEHGCPQCVRGLLCRKCNWELLPAIYHSPQIATNAANYLREPPTSGYWVQPEVLAGNSEPAPF